mmetsp:Transcript_119649/g.217396  ORF Transcript_119649/g.217396 Transcript_119649/m.217396 type:complete len:202 (-) Transcript_119649:917-1522(-)
MSTAASRVPHVETASRSTSVVHALTCKVHSTDRHKSHVCRMKMHRIVCYSRSIFILALSLQGHQIAIWLDGFRQFLMHAPTARRLERQSLGKNHTRRRHECSDGLIWHEGDRNNACFFVQGLNLDYLLSDVRRAENESTFFDISSPDSNWLCSVRGNHHTMRCCSFEGCRILCMQFDHLQRLIFLYADDLKARLCICSHHK